MSKKSDSIVPDCVAYCDKVLRVNNMQLNDNVKSYLLSARFKFLFSLTLMFSRKLVLLGRLKSHVPNFEILMTNSFEIVLILQNPDKIIIFAITLLNLSITTMSNLQTGFTGFLVSVHEHFCNGQKYCVQQLILFNNIFDISCKKCKQQDVKIVRFDGDFSKILRNRFT